MKKISNPLELAPEALLSMRQAAVVMNVSEKYMRKLVSDGEVRCIHWGESQEPRVPRWALKEWQERALRGQGRSIDEMLSYRPRRRAS
ncbi:MAG: hypothetical protein AB1428_12955 [Bacteroidota bacterium]